MIPIDNFLRAEEAKMSWIEKLLMNYPRMRSTQELAGSAEGLSIESEKIIRPSFVEKIVAILLSIFLIVYWYILFNLLARQILVPVTIGAILFIGFIIWIGIWNTFFNRKYVFTIKLNRNHIEIDKKMITWAEVAETQIMRKALQGRQSHLIIFTKDNQVFKYSLFKFSISNRRISTLIEFYKGHLT